MGRNGSGKSTLLKIAAGLVEPDRGVGIRATWRARALSAAGAGFLWLASTLAYVEAGEAKRRPHAARYLLEQLGLTGHEDPAHLSGGEARRAQARARAGAAARYPAAR